MYAASQALLENDAGRAGELLEQQIPKRGEENFRGPEWYLLKSRIKSQELNRMNGKQLAENGGEEEEHPWIVSCLAASPDGRLLASGGWSEKGASNNQSTFFVWEPESGRKIFGGPPGIGSVKSLQFTADGKELMVAALGKTRFFSSRDGTPTGRDEIPGTYAAMAHGKPWLATTTMEETAGQSSCLVLYDMEQQREIRRIPRVSAFDYVSR